MPAVDPVILQLRADVANYQNQLKSTTILVTQQLDRQERAIHSLEQEVSRSTTRIGAAFSSMGRAAAGFIAGFGLGTVISEMASLADQAKQLDAQLKLATAGFGSFGQAQADVSRIAEQTRGSLDATAKLYAGFVRASQETGRTQSDAARATQTFAEALKIGGAGAAEAASATLQFNQALQSGVLRGDEFNSILEASPRIARLLADALGVPIGQLRSMAEEGKITSDVLFRGLTERKFTAGIDNEFKQIPVTFGDAMQAVQNAALTTFSEFDKGGQFSDAIVAFLSTGTDTFTGLGDRARDFGAETRAVFDGLSNLFDPIGANGNAVFDALGIKIFSVRDQIASLLDSFDRFANFDANIENFFKRGFNKAIQRAGGTVLFQETPLSNLGGNFRAGANRRDAQTRERAAEDKLNARFGGIEGLSRFVSDPNKYGIFGNRLPSGATPPSSGDKGGRKRTGGISQAERDAAKAERDLNGIIAAIRRAVADDSGFDKLGRPDSEVQDERAAASKASFKRVFGTEGRDFEDPFASVAEYDKRIAAEGEARQKVNDELAQRQEDQVYRLADIYEDAFTAGSGRGLENFKRDALRIIAQLLAQATVASFSKGGGGFGSLLGNIAQGASLFFGGSGGKATVNSSAFSGAGSSLVGTGLPRLANGGLIKAGGLGGVDRNVLSVNGVPRAMISANEMLGVIPPHVTRAAPRGGPAGNTYVISVSADNSVTPAGFARSLASDILSEARRMDKISSKATLRDVPGSTAQRQSLKG